MSFCAICQGLSWCCWNHSFLSSPLAKIRVWKRCLKKNSSCAYLFNYLLGTHRTQTSPLTSLRLTFVLFLLPSTLKLPQNFEAFLYNHRPLNFTPVYWFSWNHWCLEHLPCACMGSQVLPWLTLILECVSHLQFTAIPDRSPWWSDTSRPSN